MLFDDEFLASIPSDPIASGIAVCELALAQVGEGGQWMPEEHAALLEGFTLLVAMREGDLIRYLTDEPDLGGMDVPNDCRRTQAFLKSVQQELGATKKTAALESLKNRFANKLKTGFAYEFTQADLQRIQTLVNQLRDQVASSDFFEPDHQTRLLKRLEQLQQEMHKRVSDLDRFWGLIGDAGVALGRAGMAAKPFVDRISEITQIVWNTQKQSEGLPSNAPLPLLTSEKTLDGNVNPDPE